MEGATNCDYSDILHRVSLFTGNIVSDPGRTKSNVIEANRFGFQMIGIFSEIIIS